MKSYDKSFKEFVLFGRTEVRIEDVSDDDFVDLLLDADAYVRTESLTPQEIIEKYGVILTEEQKQIIYEHNKI